MKGVVWWLGSLGLIAVLSWVAFSEIDFDANPLNVLPQDLPQVTTIREYERDFAARNDTLIAVSNQDLEIAPEAAASLRQFLSKRTDLFSTLSGTPPWEEDPSQMGELLAYLWFNGTTNGLQELVNRFSENGINRELENSLDVLENSMDVAEITRASVDPLNLSNLGGQDSFRLDSATRLRFVSDDGHLHVILAEPAGTLDAGRPVFTWKKAVEKCLAEWRKTEPDLAEGTAIQITGRTIYITEMRAALLKDLFISLIITLGFIVILFWVLNRRLMPLILLLGCLYVTGILTLLVGVLLFAELSATSVGFAAILVGIAVDYGFVIYQESRCAQQDARRLRHVFGRSIGWAALTTALVFLALNLSDLPGVAQLGTMVAVGIAVGSLVMITLYASGLGRLGVPPLRAQDEEAVPHFTSRRFAVGANVILGALVAIMLVWKGFPALNEDPETLRPEKSQKALETYRSIRNQLSGQSRTVTLLASGETDEEILGQFDRAAALLATPQEHVAGYTLPRRLWPDTRRQEANRALIAALVKEETRALSLAESQDFIDESLTMTKGVFAAWNRFLEETGPPTLEHPASRWLLDRLFVDDERGKRALGFVRLEEGRITMPVGVSSAIEKTGIHPVGWEFLGPSILGLLAHDFKYVVLPTAGFLLIMLLVVFRSVKGVCLSICMLLFSAAILLAVMRLLGIEWNVVNVAAIPLLLGLGLDYSIHVILALRRTHGDIIAVRRNIGRALLMCGVTTAIGFASLKWARHGGLPMLGELCALGILITMFTAVFLLPHWWRFLHRKEKLA